MRIIIFHRDAQLGRATGTIKYLKQSDSLIAVDTLNQSAVGSNAISLCEMHIGFVDCPTGPAL